MELKLMANELLWEVRNTKGIVAKIFLDSFKQISEIVLFSPTESERKTIIQLCCNHVYRFIKYRYKQPRIIPVIDESPEKSNQIEKYSELLMDFYAIDSRLSKASIDALMEILKEFSVPVIEGVVPEFEDALKTSIKSAAENSSIKIKYRLDSYHSWSNSLVLEISSSVPLSFWSHSSKYERKYEDNYLNIIPKYHPAEKGRLCLMINGDTDAYISGKTIGSIYAPEESRSEAKGFGTSWAHMKHPYIAKGNSFKISISRTHFLSQEGIDELTKILKAILGTSEEYYVGINGGFTPPYKCPHNRLLELGLLNKMPRPRGSEASCVWEYRTLKEEGQLEGAFIPKWFIQENWLEIYEDAEEVHGIY